MKPAVLLVPGVMCDAGVWREVTRALQGHADVRVALPLQDSISAMAEAAWQALADLPERSESAPLLLAGFSLGGYVVQEMLCRPAAGARPVHAAALLSTSPRPESPEARVQREKTMAAMGRDFARVVEGVIGFASHSPSPALAARLREMMLAVGADTAVRQNRAIVDRADHRAALARLQLPVAVACGVHDKVTPPELSRELAALLPRSQLCLVEGAGHMLPCEQPDAVAQLLRNLLGDPLP